MFVELRALFRRHAKNLADFHTEASLTFTDITTNDVTTSKHGFTPKAPNDTTKYLRGDATWAITTAITIATEQATTSGTSIDFTGIPSGTKRVTVMLEGVSTNGTSSLMIQIGDSGGIETSGYLGGFGPGGAAFSGGFQIAAVATASLTHALILLALKDSPNNTWSAAINTTREDAVTFTGAGHKSTSAVLDRVRLTTVNGTDAFDAGSVSISYE